MVLSGFNTDIKYRGETYHVQTEDNGLQNPVVLTLLYYKGAILASKKTSYSDLLKKPAYQKDLMELMKAQHKEIMREMLAGAYDAIAGGAIAAPSPAISTQAPDVSRPAPTALPLIETSAPLSLDQSIMRYLEQYAASIAHGAAIALLIARASPANG